MNIDDFKRARVQGAEYGAAPAELLAEYQALIKKMEQMYEEGIPLTSEPMLALNKRVDELFNEIDKFRYPRKDPSQ